MHFLYKIWGVRVVTPEASNLLASYSDDGGSQFEGCVEWPYRLFSSAKEAEAHLLWSLRQAERAQDTVVANGQSLVAGERAYEQELRRSLMRRWYVGRLQWGYIAIPLLDDETSAWPSNEFGLPEPIDVSSLAWARRLAEVDGARCVEFLRPEQAVRRLEACARAYDQALERSGLREVARLAALYTFGTGDPATAVPSAIENARMATA